MTPPRSRSLAQYRRVLSISLPLVASMASTTVILYTDRLFLGHYSMEALAAATPAGITAFMFSAFFLGVVGYVNTFVAQHVGADQPGEVGPSIWQGLYVSLAGGLFLAGASFLAVPLFRAGGHEAAVQVLEVRYFRILMLGGILLLLRDTLSCFYSGRGLTRTIMVVTMAGAVLNVPLDYLLINGIGPFPEWGIRGAAVASLAGHGFSVIVFAFLVFRRKYEAVFRVRSGWAFQAARCRRLLRFGFPNGLQFFIDIFAFSFFLFLVGRLGAAPLAATNIAFANNLLAFLPMVGFSIATSTLVGQSIGEGRPEEGAIATRRALELTLFYMWIVAVIFVVFPGQLVDLFRPGDFDDAAFAPIRSMSIRLLRFVAFFTLFDAVNLVYSAALKGAGDTRFVGWSVAGMSTAFLVLPVYIVVEHTDGGVYVAWAFATAYVCLLAALFRWRFRQGRWKSMRVIDEVPVSVPPYAAEVPAVEELR